MHSLICFVLLLVVSDGSVSKELTFSKVRALFQRLFRHQSRGMNRWKETKYNVCYNPYTINELEVVLRIKAMRLAKNRPYINRHQQCGLTRSSLRSTGKFVFFSYNLYSSRFPKL